MGYTEVAMPHIRFTNRLDRHVECPSKDVNGSTILSALQSYFAEHAMVEGYVIDERLQLRTHMTIFVNGQPIRDRNNLHQAIDDDAVIDVIQALSGG